MTNKEIEAIADRLRTMVEYFCQAVEMEDGAQVGAFEDIDALCAAARREDSLVGKRTPEIKPNFTPVKLEALVVCTDCGAVHAADCRRNTLDRNGPQTGACPVCGNPSIRPLDFEVLEGSDA